MASRTPSQNTMLYVGDLPATVTDDFLRQLFAEVGTPTDVVLKTNKTGKQSACAFVRFADHEIAERALTELNYTKLDYVPIRISWYDPKIKAQSTEGNLFIKNLDESIEVSQIHEAFSNFGEILSCKIPLTGGKSRGYGFVQFRNKADAEQAMKDLAGASINGRPVTIELYRRRPKLNAEDTYTNVYVRNLPDSVKTNEDLAALFSDYGEVQSPCLRFNEDNVTPRGFGFCNFADHESAVKAVTGLNGKQIEDKVLDVMRHQSRTERQQALLAKAESYRREQYEKTKDRDLYIRGFDESVTNADLEAAFSRFGEIESCKIQYDESQPDRPSMKFGFVLFKNSADALRALKESITLTVKDSAVYVAFWKPKSKLIAQQSQQSHHGQHKAAMPAQGHMMMNPQTQPMPYQQQQVPFANPMGTGALQMTQQTPRNMLRQGITEMCQEQNKDPQEFLNKTRGLSDDQCRQLNEDQELLLKWIGSQ